MIGGWGGANLRFIWKNSSAWHLEQILHADKMEKVSRNVHSLLYKFVPIIYFKLNWKNKRKKGLKLSIQDVPFQAKKCKLDETQTSGILAQNDLTFFWIQRQSPGLRRTTFKEAAIFKRMKRGEKEEESCFKDGSENRRIRRITEKANGVRVNKKKRVREEYKEEEDWIVTHRCNTMRSGWRSAPNWITQRRRQQRAGRLTCDSYFYIYIFPLRTSNVNGREEEVWERRGQ